MFIKVYFSINNERADDWRDFYKFSRKPIGTTATGLPICLGGCVMLDQYDPDAALRLFKTYMKDAKQIINTRWRNPMYYERNDKTPADLSTAIADVLQF